MELVLKSICAMSNAVMGIPPRYLTKNQSPGPLDQTMKKGSGGASGPLNICGGEEEDRTPDLRIANATLSQLSYPPNRVNFTQNDLELPMNICLS